MFKLKSKYSPTWDQPEAINTLMKFINSGHKFQTLWWVTWSWKTFTMANIIEKVQKPTLIIAHNKTLAAQLALEFKDFFPDNAVHYFVSYYDYYQPEAYVWKTDTYIEKEATINEEIDRLRHAATQSLIQRKDVIIVASVSCIYGVWDIKAYQDSVFELWVWDEYHFDDLIKKLLLLQYKRAWEDFKPWTFVVMWDLLEIFPSSQETVYSLEFWGNEISRITRRNYLTWEIYEVLDKIDVFPAKHTVTTKDTINAIIPLIQEELKERLEYFEMAWEVVKHERLKTKVEYDIEMMQEVWYVNGIENYSRYLDGRKPWAPPATLIDYFWDDFLCLVDESHMTISQIWWMYAWDRARKENLVNAGFRLPSAMDNRPLKFNEFEKKMSQMILVSATPWEYDIVRSCEDDLKSEIKSWEIEIAKADDWSEVVEFKNYFTSSVAKKRSEIFFSFDPTDWKKWKPEENLRIVPQVIRPTWLLDPIIELRSMKFMVDDIINNIKEIVDKNEKMLITTLTKRSSEELTDYLLENWVKVKYLHSEIETLDRIDILRDLRTWKIDVIVWVNLLREWLDLPEVTKIAILDSDKQWFLRSPSALIQIIWRAARNSNWVVYMYTETLDKKDKIAETILRNDHDFMLDERGWKIELFKYDNWKMITREWFFVSNAMKIAINLTNYRRRIQNEYNIEHSITPTTVFSEIKDIWIKTKKKDYALISEKDLEKEVKRLEFEMWLAAANMDYEKAADLRDELIDLKRGLKR
jgi:excinuclease ABC subunit B